MASPGANSLLNSGSLSSPSLQHSPDQHFAVYSPTASCLAQQLEKHGSPCDAFGQSLHHPFLADFSDVQELNECGDAQQFQEIGGHVVGCGPISGGNGMEDRLSARRIHKADREKLRRDKLNEQFSELASALDPDRPKNDKATILGESVQVVKDLRDEVKRLKTEQASLLNESHDLSQEKNELREEKATLKNETEQLQSQLHQRLRALPPWMALDPSLVMGAAAFPYPVPVPQPVSLSQPDSRQVGPPPYMPLAPPLGAFHVHPSLQAYAMFGNRPGEGGNPFLPYPSFPQPVNSHSHIERPYAQYPSPIHPVTSYVVQISQSQGSANQLSPPSSGTPLYRPCVPGIPVVSAENQGSSPISKEGSHRSLPTSQGNSEHVPTDPEQCLDVTASLSHLRATGSAVGQDRMAVPPSPKQKDVCSDTHKGESPSSTSVVPPTFSLEHGVADTGGTRLAGNELANLRAGSKGESEHVHDPTLRPPAA